MAKKKKRLVDAVEEAPPELSPEAKKFKNRIRELEKTVAEYRTEGLLIVDAVRGIMGDGLNISTPKPPPKSRKKKREEVAVLHLSDLQVGKQTATYSTSIALDRVMLFGEKAIKATRDRRHSAKIDECVVYLGGDLVEGEEIFTGQVHEIDSSVFAQALRAVPEIIVELVLLLAQEFPRVRIKGVVGNHGRNGPRGTRAHPKTNWDRVAMETARLALKREKQIDFAIADSWFFVDNVLGWSNLVVHGDQIRGGFAGFPWYGVGRKAAGWKSAVREWESDGDRWNRYLWLGHFHTPASCVINDVIMLANGTPESDNVYAASELAAAGRPAQRLAFFDSANGLISDNVIWLD